MKKLQLSLNTWLTKNNDKGTAAQRALQFFYGFYAHGSLVAPTGKAITSATKKSMS